VGAWAAELKAPEVFRGELSNGPHIG
jgi:hypothetical protein